MSDEARIYAAVEAFQEGRPGALAADAEVVGPRRASTGRVEIRFLRSDVALVHLRGPGVTTLVLSRTRDVWRIDAAHTSGSKGEQR